MIHIVHVTAQMSKAGSGRAICAAARHLIPLGVKHTLISLLPARDGSEELLQEAGIMLLETPSNAELIEQLKQADIVRFEWWNNPRIIELIHSALPPMRLLIYVHNCGDHYPNLLTRELVDFVDFCVAGCRYTHTHGVLAELPEKLRREKTATVLAAPDFSRLTEQPPQAHEGFVISYIGDLTTKKRHPDLISMSSAARIPGVRFIIRGKGDAKPLQQQVRELKLEHCFDVGEFCDDIGSILAITDVFGYPLNLHPAAELCVQEALYAGAVPVVFPLGGLRDLVIHEYTGLVVEDAAGYTAALEYLYEHPQDLARMSANARQYARQMLGAERSASKLMEIYQLLMKQAKREHSWPSIIAESTSALRFPGVELFLRTLGLVEPESPFQISLHSTDLDAVFAAEQAIGEMANHQVLHRFAEYHPDDGYLQLWAGLDYNERGEYKQASESFRQASRGGLRHWRVWFYLARAAEQLGRVDESHKLCQKVLDLAVNFHPAMAMLRRMNARLHKPRQAKLVLFSYPRSGNTWLRYILEVLTGRPSIAADNIINDPPICVRVGGLEVNREAQPSAIKCHRLSEIDASDRQQPLLVVVRNYKECIVRNRYDLLERNFDFEQEHLVYLEPLRYYHDFTGTKLLIYYEMLMQSPEQVITELARFLNLSGNVGDDFLRDYQDHFERSLTGYPRSQTGGKKTAWHANKLTAEQRLSWDRQMRAADPEVFDRYLADYCEQGLR